METWRSCNTMEVWKSSYIVEVRRVVLSMLGCVEYYKIFLYRGSVEMFLHRGSEEGFCKRYAWYVFDQACCTFVVLRFNITNDHFHRYNISPNPRIIIITLDYLIENQNLIATKNNTTKNKGICNILFAVFVENASIYSNIVMFLENITKIDLL